MCVYIGCAGWNVRTQLAEAFPSSGAHLERYASGFNAVEINSSFYRPHRYTTYDRWANSTPSNFRFAVKLPKDITHVRRLVDVDSQVERFAGEVAGLADKLGALLVQLPPSLTFDHSIAKCFVQTLRAHFAGPIVCEPRHASWFDNQAESLLEEYTIGRVAADPSIVPKAATPASSLNVTYYRWHGSPRIYYSSYDATALAQLAHTLVHAKELDDSVWCIFDNTAAGAATENALQLKNLVQQELPEVFEMKSLGKSPA